MDNSEARELCIRHIYRHNPIETLQVSISEEPIYFQQQNQKRYRKI